MNEEKKEKLIKTLKAFVVQILHCTFVLQKCEHTQKKNEEKRKC